MAPCVNNGGLVSIVTITTTTASTDLTQWLQESHAISVFGVSPLEVRFGVLLGLFFGGGLLFDGNSYDCPFRLKSKSFGLFLDRKGFETWDRHWNLFLHLVYPYKFLDLLVCLRSLRDGLGVFRGDGEAIAIDAQEVHVWKVVHLVCLFKINLIWFYYNQHCIIFVNWRI